MSWASEVDEGTGEEPLRTPGTSPLSVSLLIITGACGRLTVAGTGCGRVTEAGKGCGRAAEAGTGCGRVTEAGRVEGEQGDRWTVAWGEAFIFTPAVLRCK